jgi:glucose-1-phosphate cytidylyltransferase
MANDFTINLGAKRKVSYHNRHSENWNITLVDTGLETKKGTRIKKIEPYIKEDRFMLTYGDGVGNIDIKELVSYHLKDKKIVTFTGVHPISRFARVNLDKQCKVSSWIEKRKIEEYVNAGFFVLERKIFDYLDENCELEEEPMEELAKAKQIAMYRHEGFWYCMDTYRDYIFLQNLWEKQKAPWKIW